MELRRQNDYYAKRPLPFTAILYRRQTGNDAKRPETPDLPQIFEHSSASK